MEIVASDFNTGTQTAIAKVWRYGHETTNDKRVQFSSGGCNTKPFERRKGGNYE